MAHTLRHGGLVEQRGRLRLEYFAQKIKDMGCGLFRVV